MSELNDLLTTRELQRWRLILGEAAETTLCGLDDNARQIDHALEWLYGRDPERLQRGERSGGLGGSNLTTPEWINSIHTLFPQQVIERLESDAVLRYGIEDVVTNLDMLERMQPSESLLRAVLHTKHLMNPEVLAAARRIVRQVVEEIMARLAKEVLCALTCNTGTRNTASCISNPPALTAALNAKANNGNWSYWLIKADRWWTR
ncbi:VMA domain YehL ATPase stimulator [Escherichia coli]|nr:VMA domain YehL ATPase stimulator [Escherichia coli]GCR16619.1 VMA domain YehL ATPase stimulator [Escherichia coli]